MSNSSDIIRGHTDSIILSRLCQSDSYGYQINKEILQATDNQFELKEATLYTAFRRLEEAGMITSYWGSENLGARRRYYTITKKGREANEENRTEWQILKKMLDTLILK